MDLERFSDKSNYYLSNAQKLALANDHQHVLPIHVLHELSMGNYEFLNKLLLEVKGNLKILQDLCQE